MSKAPFHGGFQEASMEALREQDTVQAIAARMHPKGEHMEAAGDGGPEIFFTEARRGARSEGPGIARQDRRVDGGAGLVSRRMAR